MKKNMKKLVTIFVVSFMSIVGFGVTQAMNLRYATPAEDLTQSSARLDVTNANFVRMFKFLITELLKEKQVFKYGAGTWDFDPVKFTHLCTSPATDISTSFNAWAKAQGDAPKAARAAVLVKDALMPCIKTIMEGWGHRFTDINAVKVAIGSFFSDLDRQYRMNAGGQAFDEKLSAFAVTPGGLDASRRLVINMLDVKPPSRSIIPIKKIMFWMFMATCLTAWDKAGTCGCFDTCKPTFYDGLVIAEVTAGLLMFIQILSWVFCSR